MLSTLDLCKWMQSIFFMRTCNTFFWFAGLKKLHIRIYIRASPGLLHIAPKLQSDVYREPTKGPVERVPIAGETAAGASSGYVVSAGGSEEKSTDTSTVPPAPPLRVGFVSKFFGEQVSTPICAAIVR